MTKRLELLIEYYVLRQDFKDYGTLSASRRDRLDELKRELWPSVAGLVAEHAENPMNHIGRVRRDPLGPLP